MIEDRKLLRNATWNFLGSAAPMLVAVAAVPPLLRALGSDRFGILTLAWTLIGYCSLFDLGLGRALTKLVAEALASSGRQEDLGSTVWTALVLMLALSLVGTIAIAGGASFLGNSFFQIPLHLRGETAVSIRLIAASIPLVIVAAGLRGLLEAHQLFGWLSVVRTITGILTFLAPLIAQHAWGNLPALVLSLAAVRVLTLLAMVSLCAVFIPGLLSARQFRLSLVGPLFRFGGWLTVTNVISPLMVYMDRFLLGAMLPVSNVAYYATPYEVVSKLQAVPAAITAALFPVFSGSSNKLKVRSYFFRGIGLILGALVPITLLVALLARPGLTLWLGPDFAAGSYRVLQLLAFGVLINATASVPATLLQASGRPDLNAKLHLLELPLYLTALVVLVRLHGIEGAALAWVGRVTLDAALLFLLARHRMVGDLSNTWEVVNGAQPSAPVS